VSVITSIRKHLADSDNSLGLEIQGTDGFYIKAAGGKKYLDFTSGWCVGNLAWGNKEIRKAIHQYRGPDYVYPGFFYQPWAELAEVLCEMAPGKLNKVYRCTGGTEAVDAALQIAMVATGRKKFLSFEDSYHGNSVAALSVGASSTRDDLPALLPGCIKIKGEPTKDKLSQIETQLKSREVAAFIMEPVQMNLGVQIPDKEFMTGLEKLCKKYGTLLIADEVACGFGRTGKLFACEHFGLEPDILTLAKGLSGGYGAIGATLTTDKIYNKVKGKVNVYSTYGWHPVSVSATIANLRYITENKNQLLQKIETSSLRFRTALSQMEFKKGGRLSIIGLAIAVDVDQEKYASSIKDKCQDKGLLITSQESKLVLFPPLTITRAAIDEGIQIIKDCI
jgi:adenosylmethionine-8-amino-7-oxononanoate aminotransferase